MERNIDVADAVNLSVLPSFQTLSWTQPFLRFPISSKLLEEPTTELGFGMGASFPNLSDLLERVNDDENIVGDFADSRIEFITVCPGAPRAHRS